MVGEVHKGGEITKVTRNKLLIVNMEEEDVV